MAKKIVRFFYRGQRFDIPDTSVIEGRLEELFSSLSSMAEEQEAIAGRLLEAEQEITALKNQEPAPQFFVMTKEQYDAMPTHERNVPYFIIEPEERKFWRIGDPLPAVVGDYGLAIGDPLPIIIGGKDYLNKK
jgi:hypothetical protein